MIKQFKAYEFKNISLKVEDIDMKSRQVKIALSAFDVIDSDLDIIRPGAFAKSITERGPQASGNRKIAHLRNHDWTHQIGNPQELFETEKNLIMVSTLGRATKGNDALLDYQDEIIKEHSFGFSYIQDKIEWIEDTTFESGGFYDVKEVHLFEGSAVAFGANEFTPTLDVAKGNKEDAIKILNEEMTALIGALKNGQGSDDRLYYFEMRLKVIQEKYNSLILAEPFVKDTPKEEPDSDKVIAEKRKKDFLSHLIS